MGRHILRILILLMFVCVGCPEIFAVTDTTYSGNYIVVENQSGFLAEEYETRVAKKFERGLKNLFLGWLEIPHGVKSHIAYREDNYLPVGIETYFLGLFRGAVQGVGRTAVGFYEMLTPFFIQGPILVEMEEWLY